MARIRKKYCCECKRSLVKDEIALSQKFLGRDIDEFYCIDCLAVYLECPVMDLHTKILEFKEQGCTLFL